MDILLSTRNNINSQVEIMEFGEDNFYSDDTEDDLDEDYEN